MDKILMIINPSSGERSGSAVGQKLYQMLRAKQAEVKIYETTGKDDFESLIQREMITGLETVIVLGGDGTLSEVVNGISRLEKRPKVLPLPLGTTNNFTRVLQIDQNADVFLEAIHRGSITEKDVDVGQVNEHYFISTVSVGSLPEAAWQTDDDLKETLGSFAYVLEGAKVLSEFHPFSVEIETEEGTYHLDEAFFIVVGLANSIFGIESFFSEATVDDGKLHLFALKKSNLLTEAGTVLKHILLNKAKKEIKDDESLVLSFVEGVIRSASSLNSTVGGEKGPKFPLKLSVKPKHITFLIPRSEQ